MIIRENVPLAPYTTFRIGGHARYFAEAETEQDVATAFHFAEKQSLPVFVLGAGSNLLISDEGFSGLVIHLTNTEVHYADEGDSVLVTVSAGKEWDELVEDVVARGLWGIENLSGIPSSVGATPVQNIGAYGTEVEHVIERVDVYDRTAHVVRTFTHDECEFGYRESVFKHVDGTSLVVLRVVYRLRKNGTPNISYKDLSTYHEQVKPITTLCDVRDAVCAIRSKKFPQKGEAGTAGSFFKNPIVSEEVATKFLKQYPDAPSYPQKDGHIKLSAGWIIDHVLHMKGVREGDVGTWDAQALVVVNYGTAKASDVVRFVSRINITCEHEVGLKLYPEVVLVGEIKFDS